MIKIVPEHLRAKAKKCVFYNEPGLTKTHIWPDWLRKTLPRDTVHHTRIIRSNPNDANNWIRGVELRESQGDIFSQKPRLACARCNNGWMKNFENELSVFVKPIILREYVGDLTIIQKKVLQIGQL